MEQERSLDRARPRSRDMDRDRRDRRGSNDAFRERDRRDSIRGSYDAYRPPAPRFDAGSNYEVVCKFFQSTGCKFGARCLYKHIGRRVSRVRSRSRSGERRRCRSGSIDGFGRRTFYAEDDMKSGGFKGESSSIMRDKSLLAYDKAEQKRKECKDGSHREHGRCRQTNVPEDKNKSMQGQKAERKESNDDSFKEFERSREPKRVKEKSKFQETDLNGKKRDSERKKSPSESDEIKMREQLLLRHQMNTSTRKSIRSISPSPPLSKSTRTVTIITNSLLKREDKSDVNTDLKSVTQNPEKNPEITIPEKKESPPPRCSKCGQKIMKRRVTE